MKYKLKEYQLKNGIRGLLIDVPDTSVVNISLNFRAGNFLTPEGKWEVAHLMEHVMFGANKKFAKARDFQAELQKNGANFNATTDTFDITYLGECADFEFKRFFELWLIAIEEPFFKQDEFTAEMGNVRAELRSSLNSHADTLDDVVNQAHGYPTVPTKERLEQLKNIQPSDIRNHYNKTHTSDNLRFIIAGAVAGKEKEIINRLERLDLPRGKRIARPKEKLKPLEDVLYIEQPGVSTVYFTTYVFKSSRLSDAEDDSLKILDTMLTATIHSGILGEAREKGLAYHIASWHGLGRSLSWWSFGAQVDRKNAEPVFEIITRNLNNILHGKVSKKSIEDAKTFFIGQNKLAMQTVGSIARYHASRYYFNGTILDFSKRESQIRSVDKKRIVAVAQKMFKEQLWSVGVLGSNKEKIARTLHSAFAVLWHG